LGNQEIATFGNAQMREFVACFAEKKLAPKTSLEVSNAVRQIIASVVDGNGDEAFPGMWNSDFIDAPIVEKQKEPTVTGGRSSKPLQRRVTLMQLSTY
jgi:hypothetical protein